MVVAILIFLMIILYVYSNSTSKINSSSGNYTSSGTSSSSSSYTSSGSNSSSSTRKSSGSNSSSSTRKSSGSNSSTGAGGYDMPNSSDKSFSDYVKRVDPGLYNDMQKRYDSLK